MSRFVFMLITLKFHLIRILSPKFRKLKPNRFLINKAIVPTRVFKRDVTAHSVLYFSNLAVEIFLRVEKGVWRI